MTIEQAQNLADALEQIRDCDRRIAKLNKLDAYEMIYYAFESLDEEYRNRFKEQVISAVIKKWLDKSREAMQLIESL